MFMNLPHALVRKIHPRSTRPTSNKASLALAAKPSAWDSTGSDDSLAWLDMVPS
jgi:hypothetical protein